MDKESVLLDSEDRMDKALGALDRDFSRLRTGRASTGLVDNIKVDYYGTPTPISQLASVAIPDSRTITIQPWDRGAFAGVEKAILKSDLGLTPVNDGKIIRISIPPLTEDRRKELGKLARKSGEEAKVAVRNVRRDAVDYVKKAQKKGELTEDDQKKSEKDIQDLIDFVAEYKDPDNYRWFFWESWLDIDMHRAEGENSFIDAMKSQLEDMAMEAMMDLSCLGYCLGL